MPANMRIFLACEPITDRMEMGSVVAESDLRIEVYTTTEGGNQVVMSNETPQVGSFWDYIVSTSVRQKGYRITSFPWRTQNHLHGTLRRRNRNDYTYRKDRQNRSCARTGMGAFSGNGEKEGKTWVWDNEGLYGEMAVTYTTSLPCGPASPQRYGK